MNRHNPPRPSFWDALPLSHLNAAGLDIGSDEIWACRSPARARPPQPVRRFGTFTPYLQALAVALACDIETARHGINRRVLDSSL